MRRGVVDDREDRVIRVSIVQDRQRCELEVVKEPVYSSANEICGVLPYGAERGTSRNTCVVIAGQDVF